MFNPLMVCDGFAHGRLFVMDLHIGHGLLSG
jgi:hypothetical protein